MDSLISSDNFDDKIGILLESSLIIPFVDDRIVKLFGLNTEGSIGDIFATLQGKIMNMGNELSKMYIVITDTFGNLFSVITVFYYMVQGGIITAETIFTENITGTLIDIVGGI